MGQCCGGDTAQPPRVIILGVDNAGKTTLLYTLKGQHDNAQHAARSNGFNVEDINCKPWPPTQPQPQARVTKEKNNNKKLKPIQNITAWDIDGQDKIRPLWHHFYPGTHAVIFVINAANTLRLPLAKEELHVLLNERELEGLPFLIFANKQDVRNCQSAFEMSLFLSLTKEDREEEDSSDTTKRRRPLVEERIVNAVREVIREHYALEYEFPVLIVELILSMLPGMMIQGVTEMGEHPFCVAPCVATLWNEDLHNGMAWLMTQLALRH